jgi:hypothetical protein
MGFVLAAREDGNGAEEGGLEQIAEKRDRLEA